MIDLIIFDRMRIAVRPPEYLPRLSYIALMNHVDLFVVADTYQYSRQSFQNRARIRTPHGWSWISVPLVGRQHGMPVFETRIDNRPAWQSKHSRAMQYNYGNTIYYPFYEDQLASLYATSWDMLADLGYASIELFHKLFGLNAQLCRATELEGQPATLPAILKHFAYSELVVPAQAFEKDKTLIQSVSLFDFVEPEYRQHFEGYEPEITAFDILCNYGTESRSLIL